MPKDHYIVSARKYRPATFDTVVGQKALTTTLKNAIATGKLAHAYLFCGPRGVGKTTCARIFAKTINCLSPKENGEACGACESCRTFEEKRSYNIIELDAASNNSIEDIRQLIEQVMIPPQVGRYKVFIIDEVHMLSSAAFNAFLKTLEEPPAHVIFILATTEKHKILPTILSRCQIYDFARMEVPDIVAHLKAVAEKEGYTYEDEALGIIARKADGGMRDAMSIFDQVASYTQGNITYKKVIEDLNILDYEVYFTMTDHLLKAEIPAAMLLLNDILSRGFQGQLFVNGLAAHFRDLLVAKDEATLPLLEVAQSVRERYRTQAAQVPTRFLYRALKICRQCDQNYNTSSNKRLLVELTLIEVGQLSAPDSDACGLGPTKILKPLFTHDAPVTTTTARPVATKAAATTAASTTLAATTKVPTAATPQPSAQQFAAQPKAAPQSAPQAPTARPALRTLSIRGVHRQAQTATSAAAGTPSPAADVVTEVRPFDEQALSYHWYRYAAVLPQEQAAQAGRMKNIQPVIADNWVVEVPVENEMVIPFMQPLVPGLTDYLRKQLHNAAITLNLRIIKKEEQRQVYSRKEAYGLLIKENKNFQNLVQALKLEMA